MFSFNEKGGFVLRIQLWLNQQSIVNASEWLVFSVSAVFLPLPMLIC